MIAAAARAARVVVIAGNPNTGKSTLFNQLTGARVRVGNYPGITVERHRSRIQLPDLSSAEIVDSPGTYSLAARSADEQVALTAIAGLPPIERPSLVVDVVDATQLARNLYLTLQIVELGLPVIIALNMMDSAESQGLAVDPERLSRELGLPVVPVVARTGKGIDDLKRKIAAVLHDPSLGRPGWRWEPSEPRLVEDVAAVAPSVPAEWAGGDPQRARALALWSLVSLEDDDELLGIPDGLRSAAAARRNAARAAGRDIDREVIAGRYGWIDERARHFVADRRWLRTLTDRIDRVLLSPAIGFALFLALMTVVFQSLFTWATPAIDAIDALFAWLGTGARAALGGGLLADFVADGVIGGVGAFMVFLPQIVLLSLFLSLMEDTGYMARVAVLMDRIMRALGLNGRAFVPMLSGYACAVPAILATRNMERQRDRLLTIMVLPFMTCSARLPVYGLLIAAIVPVGSTHAAGAWTQGLLLAGMYLFGTVIALLAAWVLGRTMFKGPRVPLLLEMPPYRLPHARSVGRQILQQCREFVTKAGTIILLCSIVMWALLAFPRHPELRARQDAEVAALDAEAAAAPESEREAIEERKVALENAQAGELARDSVAGTLGRAIEPFIAPLGFDWKIGIGIVSAFAAREVFVSTMGVVYGVGGDVDEETPTLREKLAAARWPDGRAVFTPLVCLSLMVFFALACQCMSTLATVKRETRSWALTLFMFGYMTALAWAFSFAVYQGGRLLGFA